MARWKMEAWQTESRADVYEVAGSAQRAVLSQAVDDLVHAALRDFSVGAALFTMVCWSHSLEAARASVPAGSVAMSGEIPWPSVLHRPDHGILLLPRIAGEALHGRRTSSSARGGSERR